MFKHWKNITIYKLSREADLTDLEDKKKMILFTPCGSQDMAKFGFVSPFGDNSEVIAMHGNGFTEIFPGSMVTNPSSVSVLASYGTVRR
ncbi:recombination-associated protein RdgC [Escherichia coli]|nr:recombination-associated protein RdgC [Escherichia coli]